MFRQLDRISNTELVPSCQKAATFATCPVQICLCGRVNRFKKMFFVYLESFDRVNKRCPFVLFDGCVHFVGFVFDAPEKEMHLNLLNEEHKIVGVILA